MCRWKCPQCNGDCRNPRADGICSCEQPAYLSDDVCELCQFGVAKATVAHLKGEDRKEEEVQREAAHHGHSWGQSVHMAQKEREEGKQAAAKKGHESERWKHSQAHQDAVDKVKHSTKR